MSTPMFLVNAEEEERQELDTLLARPLDAAGVDALVSDLLGRINAAHDDLDRYVAAETNEIARISARYGSLKATVQRRIEALTVAICSLAERADFGKAKSRKVGNGVYGRRTIPARIAVLDTAKLLEWAKRAAPALVRTKITEDVPQKGVAAHFDTTGEVPDGCDHIPEHEEPFARPDIGGVR